MALPKRDIPSTLSGSTLVMAKKISRYAFGDFYIETKLDEINLRFNIFIKDKILVNDEILNVSEDLIEDFKAYWGNHFHIMKRKDEDSVSNKGRVTF